MRIVLAALGLIGIACGGGTAGSGGGGGSTTTGWTRDAGSPVVSPGPAAWDAMHAISPCVLKNGATYQMWYGGNSGADERIGYAESTDGVTWTKSSGPVFRNGAAGAWDENDVWSMCVIRDGTLRMWYTGDTHAGTGRIGHATAP